MKTESGHLMFTDGLTNVIPFLITIIWKPKIQSEDWSEFLDVQSFEEASENQSQQSPVPLLPGG